MYLRFCAVGLLIAVWHGVAQTATANETVSFVQREGALEILVGDQPFATYVYRDATIPRPFFANIHAPNGVRVTRAFPAGPDDDHGDMHPGLWMSFGDLNGHDFWRNKARTQHLRFVEPPQGGDGKGAFAVENAYVSEDGETIATETVRYAIVVDQGFLLRWTSEFQPTDAPLVFGDQEEMGLGVRVRPELAVDSGGRIHNAAGDENEAGVWGKPSQFADYRGTLDGEPFGVAIMNHPENFRTPWWHARDYGLLVANPFGRNAMTGGEQSAVTVNTGETLTLRYTVLVYTGTPDLARHPRAREAR